MILTDTTVWIDFFKGTRSVFRRKLHEMIEQEEDLCLTGIHVTEILQGIKNDVEFERTKGHLLSFPIFLIQDIGTHLHAAKIYRSCRKRGKTVRKTADCLIAATAIENGLILFHNDRDFDTIASCTGLKIYSMALKN